VVLLLISIKFLRDEIKRRTTFFNSLGTLLYFTVFTVYLLVLYHFSKVPSEFKKVFLLSNSTAKKPT